MKKTELFGLPVIMRHDYSGDQLEKIHSYVKKSVEFVVNFLGNHIDNNGLEFKRVLDVGCGDAFAGMIFEDKGFEYTGIDKYQPEEIYKPVINCSFYELDKLPFPKKFDIVFCNHTLEHADSVYRLIEQMTEILRPGGILFIAVPDGRTEWAWSLFHSTTHFSCIVPNFLDTTLKRFGYETILTTKEFRQGMREIWIIGIKR